MEQRGKQKKKEWRKRENDVREGKRGGEWKNAVEGAIVRSSGRFENKNKNFSSAITCDHEAKSSV